MKDNCQMPWEETWGKTLHILDIGHWESPTTMKCCGGMHSIHAAKYGAINRAFIRCTNLMRVWQMASRIFNRSMPSTRSGPKFSLWMGLLIWKFSNNANFEDTISGGRDVSSIPSILDAISWHNFNGWVVVARNRNPKLAGNDNGCPSISCLDTGGWCNSMFINIVFYKVGNANPETQER